MAKRTVDPELVKTLRDWVARWPKATNLGVDPETREATIYDRTKDRVRLSSIPWKRAADTLTILAQPTRFSEQAVAAATSRYGKIRAEMMEPRAAAEDALRQAEANILEAWRNYHGEPAATRAPLRRDILTAEAVLYDLQKSLAPKNREIIVLMDDDERNIMLSAKKGIYVPPMPTARRGISLVAGAEEENKVAEEESKGGTEA